MKEEISAHVNSVPARPMDPNEIAHLKELNLMNDLNLFNK
jgi:hypothetical protein